LALSSNSKEDLMSELEMKSDVETEEFSDELSDEALDREGAKLCCGLWQRCGTGAAPFRDGRVHWEGAKFT
jgi:hypothetical protein